MAMKTHTTTTAAVERTIIDCTTYKEAKAAALEFVFNHSGMLHELTGGSKFLVLDADYRTTAVITWQGFKND